ncbi:MAG: hypothetical protein R3E88_06825 [Myxococcota bacterium]
MTLRRIPIGALGRASSAAVLVAACAAPAPERAPVLTIHNALARTVREVRVKPCEADDAAFRPLADVALRAGETRRVELPSTCIDLVAVDDRDRVVGEQRGLVMLPGATWTLRR